MIRENKINSKESYIITKEISQTAIHFVMWYACVSISRRVLNW